MRISLPFRSRGATVAALLRAVAAGRPVVIGNPNLSRAQRRWAALLTNKLYFSRDRDRINAIRDQYRKLIFAT